MNRKDSLDLVTSVFESSYLTLLRYAQGVTRSRESAEDVVQDALIKLYRSLLQGQTIHNPVAWLLCVVRRDAGRLARRDYERYVRLRTFFESGSISVSYSSEVGLVSDDRLERIFAILTTREQEVMLLRSQSLTYKEIASHLGISLNTVQTLLARAMKKLRTEARTRVGERSTRHEMAETKATL